MRTLASTRPRSIAPRLWICLTAAASQACFHDTLKGQTAGGPGATSESSGETTAATSATSESTSPTTAPLDGSTTSTTAEPGTTGTDTSTGTTADASTTQPGSTSEPDTTTGGSDELYGPCSFFGSTCPGTQDCLNLEGVPGNFCAPPCDARAGCPAAPGVMAIPDCALLDRTAPGSLHCALLCYSLESGVCPAGMTCKPVEDDVGLCTAP